MYEHADCSGRSMSFTYDNSNLDGAFNDITSSVRVERVIGEIDALRGASLITVLRQLRDGFPGRPREFPASVVLCEIVEEMVVPVTEPITAAHVDDAKERLILARATHLDSLVARLMEPRVRRVIEPLVTGEELLFDPYDDDLSYARDLGLIAPANPVRIANPIYREVVARVLSTMAEAQVRDEPRAFVLPDGRLAFRRMMRAFSRFWREHGEILATHMPYPEAGPQLVRMAFMQRIVNGGGSIDREYGIGRRRIDLLVRYPYTKKDGTRAEQRRAVEVKVWRRGEKNPLVKGLAQVDEYLQGLGMTKGTLVIFDARGRLARKRVRYEDVVTKRGRRVRVMWA